MIFRAASSVWKKGWRFPGNEPPGGEGRAKADGTYYYQGLAYFNKRLMMSEVIE